MSSRHSTSVVVVLVGFLGGENCHGDHKAFLEVCQCGDLMVGEGNLVTVKQGVEFMTDMLKGGLKSGGWPME